MRKVDSFIKYGTKKIDTYSFDLMHIDIKTINQIIEAFASISQSLTSMYFSNTEEYTDKYYESFRDIYDYRSSGIPDDVSLDSFGFECEINNHRFYVSMSLDTFELSIKYDKNVEVDFLPFMINLEKNIYLKKNEGLKK